MLQMNNKGCVLLTQTSLYHKISLAPIWVNEINKCLFIEKCELFSAHKHQQIRTEQLKKFAQKCCEQLLKQSVVIKVGRHLQLQCINDS